MTAKNLSGKRIKLARTNREMPQSELCEMLSQHDVEMTQNTLSNIERGTRIIRDVELAAFAQVLDVNPAWLLFGDKPPKFSDAPFKSK